MGLNYVNDKFKLIIHSCFCTETHESALHLFVKYPLASMLTFSIVGLRIEHWSVSSLYQEVGLVRDDLSSGCFKLSAQRIYHY